LPARSQSNAAANKKYSDSLVESNRTLKVENETMKTRARHAEARNTTMEARVNELADIKGSLQEQLGTKVAESAALDEAGRRMELCTPTRLQSAPALVDSRRPPLPVQGSSNSVQRSRPSTSRRPCCKTS
jgi:hypothetical protein